MLEVEDPLYPHLMKTLYGILMLLPQSNAYKTLNERLSTASMSHQQLNGISFQLTTTSKRKKNKKEDDVISSRVNYEELLDYFDSICERHEEYRVQIHTSSSLLLSSKGLLGNIFQKEDQEQEGGDEEKKVDNGGVEEEDS